MSDTLTTITADELKDAQQGDRPPVVINVLGRDAHEAKHVPGSINVPLDDIEQVASIVPDKDQPVVVYCANADCTASPEAVKNLEEMGYTDVADFEGGYAGWRQAGYSLVGAEV
jgi:rhodanese-related sulfurtransferase